MTIQNVVTDGWTVEREEPSNSSDAMEVYFECITTCSLEDGECVTRCVEELRERH
ncbi:hypothetical protein [Cyanobium gracile]|jgi:hypothetical protein|uniref:Uncharacterized protein n=1 Tax=Cyanobium gracile (strain ATCC 27147 / PCC 6307) TaxID=292564 RepID=K9P5Q6_CYAGP|nr:hypothetical protein [Cyanobium gracile]AFY28737.1 hypothetical protein Cyagr_1579 [Cyanobium gracile PCC 6307]